MIYSYEAKDGSGRTVTGSLDANDERSAASQVRAMGYFVMNLAPQPATAAGFTGAPDNGARRAVPRSKRPMTVSRWVLEHLIYPIWSGVGLRDLALMYRQFAALLNAGVPIYQCLTTLILQTGSPTLRKCLRAMSGRIEAGGMLSDAMAEYPWIFADYHRAMIVAGETSGRLDLMFARLATALEQEYGLRANIKKELFYPGITLHGVFLIPPVFLLVVQHDVHAYLIAAVVPIIEMYAVGLLIYVLTRLGSQIKSVYDGFLAILPAIGGAVQMIALARFSRALASLYAAGVSIPQALRLASAACGNAWMGGRMIKAVPLLEQGQGIVQAFSSVRVFPPMVLSMMGTGEQTGSLDQTMDKVAEYYELEAAVRLHQLSVSLGVLVTILVGIRVAIFVIGFYTGYFSDLMKDPN